MKRITPSLAAGITLVCIVLIPALVSLFFMPYDPQTMDLHSRFAAPSAQHLLGCDHFGRDLLSRLMEASRLALASGLFSVFLGALGGIILGIAAALGPKWLETMLMRLADALMAFPTILTALALAAILGRGTAPSIIAICVAMIPTFSRLTYSMVCEGRASLYVRAARSYGAGPLRIAFCHLLPSLMGRLVTQLTSSLGSAVLLESSLSFLGLGIQPPSSSLGMMLSEARAYVLTHPYQALPPGLVLLVMVLGFNLLGDGLNDLIFDRRRAVHG